MPAFAGKMRAFAAKARAFRGLIPAYREKASACGPKAPIRHGPPQTAIFRMSFLSGAISSTCKQSSFGHGQNADQAGLPP